MRPTEAIPITDGYSSYDGRVKNFCRFISGKIAMKVYRVLLFMVAAAAAFAGTSYVLRTT